MKTNDLIVEDFKFNMINGVDDDLARLFYPQKYIQLSMNGELYNLTILYINKSKFIVGIDGKVKEGVK